MTVAHVPPTTAADVLASVQRQLAALGDGRDCRSDNEKAAYWLAFGALDRRRMTLRDTPPEIARLEPQVAAVETWLSHLRAWRAEWCEEMNTLPARAADRTREQEHRMIALTAAIRNVDFGAEYSNNCAMLATPLREKICAHYHPSWDMQTLDPWAVGYGPIATAEQRRADLVKKRDALQSRLDAALREPEPVTG